MRRILVVVIVLWAAGAAAQQEVDAVKVYLGTTPCMLATGSGSPEGAVTAVTCSTYWRTDTGDIYAKRSGTGNTGWILMVPGPGGTGTVLVGSATDPAWSATPTATSFSIPMLTPTLTSAIATNSGGSLAAGAYKVTIVQTDQASGVTLSPTAASVTCTGGSSHIDVVYVADHGFDRMRVYISAADGATPDRYFTSSSTTTYAITTLTGATVAALPSAATAYSAKFSSNLVWAAGTGLNTTKFGYNAGTDTSGAYVTALGSNALTSSTSANATGVGRLSLFGSVSDSATAVGMSSMYASVAASSQAFGYNSQYQAVGANTNTFGAWSGTNNNWPGLTRIGYTTGTVATYFPANAATDYAVLAAAITANTITGTHNFPGSNDSKINLLWTLTSGAAPTGLVTGTVYQFTRTNATTLTLAGIATGVDTVGKLTNSIDVTNSIGIGYNAVNTKSYQAMLGGSDIAETLLRGKVGIGTTAPLAALAINGGLNVGGDADPGDNNATVAGRISTSYGAGWTGTGYALDYGVSYPAQSFMEIDRLSVRGTMNVYELLVRQIRATNGSVFVSSTGRAKTVTANGGASYTIITEDAHGFAADDLIRAQRFTYAGGPATVWQSDLTVVSVTSTTEFTANLAGGATVPVAGMDYVRLGNTATADRQGSIYLTADDTNAPYLNILSGVAAFADWGATGKTRIRMGNLNGWSDYATNVYGIGMGDSAAVHMDVDATNGVRFRSAATVLGQLSGTSWTLGATATEHVAISSTAVQIKDGATVLTDIGAGSILVGQAAASQSNVYITSGKLAIRNNTTETIVLNADGSGSMATNAISWTTAGAMSIGGAAGWVVSSGYIKDVAGVVGLSSVVTAGDDVRFWAGDATPESAEFRVTEAGALTATSATITGTVNFGSGAGRLDTTGLQIVNGLDDQNTLRFTASLGGTTMGYVRMDTVSEPGLDSLQIFGHDYVSITGGSAVPVYIENGHLSGTYLGGATTAGTTYTPWDEMWLNANNTTAAYYPIVMHTSTFQLLSKTDGLNGTTSCATGHVTSIVIEYGIVTRVTCT